MGVESWKAALLIGITLSLSSTAFVMQLLQERGQIALPQGARQKGYELVRENEKGGERG